MADPSNRIPNRSARRYLRTQGPRTLGPRTLGLRTLGAVALTLLLIATACSATDDGLADFEAESGRSFLSSAASDDAADASDGSRADSNESAGAIAGDAGDMAEEAMMEAAQDTADAEEMMAESAAAEPSQVVATSLATGVPAVPAEIGRDIIYTARISVETADVAAAAAQANSIIEALGGFTFTQDARTQDRAYTMLTFRIRPEQFATALDRLSKVGELVEQTVNAEDVTDIVVDLNSRISTAEISVDRLRNFLSQATDMEGVAELERELASRESDLERLRGQLQSLQARVDLATIILWINESVEAVPDTSVVLRSWIAAGDDDPCLGFSDVVASSDGEIGLCIEVENEGETTLTDVALSSNTLRFNNNDLTVPAGASLERIEPGERVSATLRYALVDGRIAGRVATRGLDMDVRLSAMPVTQAGAELARLARSTTLSLYIEEEDSSPGFGDALSGGWGALVAIGGGILLVVGASLPFMPFIAVALMLVGWWLRRRRARRASA